MTLNKTQAIIGISTGAIIIIGFLFAGWLWAMETHFETRSEHQVSLDEAVAGFDKAISDSDARAIKREIRRLNYKLKKGIITDQELYELEGLKQELEDLS